MDDQCKKIISYIFEKVMKKYDDFDEYTKMTGESDSFCLFIRRVHELHADAFEKAFKENEKGIIDQYNDELRQERFDSLLDNLKPGDYQ